MIKEKIVIKYIDFPNTKVEEEVTLEINIKYKNMIDRDRAIVKAVWDYVATNPFKIKSVQTMSRGK